MNRVTTTKALMRELKALKPGTVLVLTVDGQPAVHIDRLTHFGGQYEFQVKSEPTSPVQMDDSRDGLLPMELFLINFMKASERGQLNVRYTVIPKTESIFARRRPARGLVREETKMFYLASKHTGDPFTDKRYETLTEARSALEALPAQFGEVYEVRFDGDPRTERILVEGLRKDDLAHILMPRVSVDEYMSKDENSDNVVVAFFVKHVPEAVEPLRTYCDKCVGVTDTDVGDSDTIANASIVYCEFSRYDLDIRNVDTMIREVAKLGQLEPGDMSVSFPHITKKYPYSRKVLELYFRIARAKFDKTERSAKKPEAQPEQKKPAQPAGKRPEPKGPSRRGNESLTRSQIHMIRLSDRDNNTLAREFGVTPALIHRVKSLPVGSTQMG